MKILTSMQNGTWGSLWSFLMKGKGPSKCIGYPWSSSNVFFDVRYCLAQPIM